MIVKIRSLKLFLIPLLGLLIGCSGLNKPWDDRNILQKIHTSAFFITFDEFHKHTDKEIILRAELKTPMNFIKKYSMNGLRVNFYKNGTFVLAAALDRTLTATAALPLPEIGFHEYTVRLHDETKWRVPPAIIQIVVESPKKPIIIVDIDHTLLDGGIARMLKSSLDESPPKDDAASVLQKITHRATIVYLTGRGDLLPAYSDDNGGLIGLNQKTKLWLRHYEFPVGPVYMWNLADDAKKISNIHKGGGHRTFKKRFLQDFIAKHPNVILGIGDLSIDAKAYLSNNIPAIIISRPDKKLKGLPASARVVDTWKEIETILDTQLTASENRR